MGKFCATFASEPDMGTDMEFGEFADWGGGVVSHVSLGKYIKHKQKKKSQCKSFGPCWPAGMHHIRNRVCSGPCVCRTGRFVWGEQN